MKAEWTNADSLTASQTTKAVLVIDMPNSCDKCLCCYEGYCVQLKRGLGMWASHTGKPVDCPLKPLPQKLKLRIQREWITDYDRYEIGYNACIDDLLGETE